MDTTLAHRFAKALPLVIIAVLLAISSPAGADWPPDCRNTDYATGGCDHTGAVLSRNAAAGGPTFVEMQTKGVTKAHTLLYAPAEADDAAYRAAIAAELGGAVDYFDARTGTPDLALLQNYACVYTWVNSPYANNVLFGDNLADFVDAV